MPSSSVYVQNWVFTPVRDNIRGTDESNSVEIITSAQSGKIGLNILIYFYYIGTTAYFLCENCTLELWNLKLHALKDYRLLSVFSFYTFP